MISYRDQIAAAVRGMRVLSPIRFQWLGRSSPGIPARARAAVPESSLRSYLVFQMEQCLYRNFYCSGGVTGWDEGEVEPAGDPGGDPYFLEALARANSGTGSYEDGWLVRAAEERRITASREGLTVVLRPEDLVESGGSEAGSIVRARFPSGFVQRSPGFYLAAGNEAFPFEGGTVVRVYWNATPDGAVLLMRRLTSGLNDARVPFRFKTVHDPGLYRRCDAAVLYLRRNDWPTVHRVLAEIHRQVARHLRAATPALTKRWAPGAGLAEDPSDGDSFGTNRCRLIADGIVRAHEAGARDVESCLAAVEARWRESGVSIDEPFLNPGSTDVYAPLEHARARTGRTRGRTPEHNDPLAGAVELGERICRTAVRHGSRCNWLGPGPARDSRRWAALGPDFYSGTGGIALVLAELHAVTGDRRFGESASRAGNECLEAVRASRPGFRSGLYDGWSGALLAAARTATLLGSPRLLRESLQCARGRTEGGRASGGFDLLAGRAGAILALLALGRLSGDASFLRFAARLGVRLRSESERSRKGISWRPAANMRTLRNLTGLAHGAAGAGLALLELFQATRDPRARRAADRAFDYENGWFDPGEGNWPDFRLHPGEAAGNGSRPAFGVAWCHGAPGIGLSRLRAFEITGSARFEREWRVAWSTTKAAVEAEVERGPAGLSLCHGLAGRWDVLREGTPKNDMRRTDLAREAARLLGYSMLADRRAPPGLMLGLAGRAYTLLRMARPEVPSLLLIRPDSFTAPRSSR